MRKLLLTTFAILGITGIAYAIETEYSSNYIHRFEVCGAYSESNQSQIPTGDKTMPVLHLKTTNSIVGIRGGKCATKVNVYARELQGNIITINCRFTKEQRMDLIKKMESAATNPVAEQQLKEKLTNYIKNRPDVCTYKNLLEEE